MPMSEGLPGKLVHSSGPDRAQVWVSIGMRAVRNLPENAVLEQGQGRGCSARTSNTFWKSTNSLPWTLMALPGELQLSTPREGLTRRTAAPFPASTPASVQNTLQIVQPQWPLKLVLQTSLADLILGSRDGAVFVLGTKRTWSGPSLSGSRPMKGGHREPAQMPTSHPHKSREPCASDLARLPQFRSSSGEGRNKKKLGQEGQCNQEVCAGQQWEGRGCMSDSLEQVSMSW